MRRLAAVLVLAFAVAPAACSDPGTSPSQSMMGRWSLQTVNGLALPFTLALQGTDSLQVLGDIITATKTGQFADTTIIRSTVSGKVTTDTIPDVGTYSMFGSTVSLTFLSDSTTTTGRLSGNTLNMGSGGTTLVYTR